MKKYSLFILLFVSVNLFGQHVDKIPKGINKIIVSTGLSEKENLRIIISKLREKEYSIQKVDSISFQIQTSPKKFKSWSYTYSFHFNIFEGKFNVSSFYNSNTGVQISGIVFNDGGQNLITTNLRQNSFQNTIFREMKGIVLDLCDESKIQYIFMND
jgi:hypothetical protein